MDGIESRAGNDVQPVVRGIVLVVTLSPDDRDEDDWVVLDEIHHPGGVSGADLRLDGDVGYVRQRGHFDF